MGRLWKTLSGTSYRVHFDRELLYFRRLHVHFSLHGVNLRCTREVVSSIEFQLILVVSGVEK